MKSEQVITLLGVMRDARGPVGGAELARALGLGQHAFKRELAALRSDLAAHGCAITGKTGRGNGYVLEVADAETFDRYLTQVLPERVRSEGRDYNDPENRVHFIIWHLLAPEDEYVRMDGMAEEMLVSRAQLSKDLAIVRDRLAYYGIRIVSRPKHGSRAEGDETALRLCLSDTLREDFHVKGADTTLSHLARPAFHRSDLARIEQIVGAQARACGYTLTDAIVQNLVIHLYVSLRRIQAGAVLELDEGLMAELEEAPEHDLAVAIATDIGREFGVGLSTAEACYLAMHLSAKKINTAEALDPQAMDLVDAMLANVRDAFRIDLSANEALRTTLCLHTAPLLKRLQYGLVFPNPLLDEIRVRLMFSYDVAACACEVINEAYGLRLAEDEIAYFALHFKVGIESYRRSRRRSVLLVTSGGRGTAELVRFAFQQHFGERLGRLDACNIYELPELDLAAYDCAFTTVPIADELPVPVYRIAPFMDEEGFATVGDALAGPSGHAGAAHYFPPERFFGRVRAASKDEAISHICELMAEVGGVPNDFAERVRAREELQASRFRAIALPGARGVVVDRTCVGVAVLDQPVDWGGGMVQVVVMCCLGEDFMEHNRGFYRFLRALIDNPALAGRLVRDPRYETLLSLFAEAM